MDRIVNKAAITPVLVSRLIAAQFPGWAGLPVTPVEHDGYDNATFRLGDGMSVRMPSNAKCALQVAKEHQWLPLLAPHLPLPIPVPLGRGVPGDGYPWPWSVYRWLEGEPAELAAITDPCRFAADLAGFLVALHQIDTAGGPRPGEHNFFRGGPVATYDAEAREAIAILAGEIDAALAARVWAAAMAATWTGPPVWVHGDIAQGNLLVRQGRLVAVIDFGGLAVGDPACDLSMTLTFFSRPGREVFRAAIGADDATWTRGRGWALWKALILLVRARREEPEDPEGADRNLRVIAEVLADHQDAPEPEHAPEQDARGW
jgi:aminoglycoside phosphotransferase (APT) family kinase protein